MEKRFVTIALTIVLVLSFSNASMSWMNGRHLVLSFSNASMSWMNGRHGGGGGYNFVDEDGDGICDNYNRGVGRNSPRYGDRERRRGMPLINILDGVPFTYTGEVISVGYFGMGTVIATEDGEITLYGLGPLWFWDNQEISRPNVGDLIEASGYAVEYNDIQRNVVASITIGGETIELRDPETGAPLWRGTHRWSSQ
jgi:hypothetical protein